MKLFQTASLFMCFCSFGTGHFSTLNTQSVIKDYHIRSLVIGSSIKPRSHYQA